MMGTINMLGCLQGYKDNKNLSSLIRESPNVIVS